VFVKVPGQQRITQSCCAAPGKRAGHKAAGIGRKEFKIKRLLQND
jgi:hypothetical protein